MSKAYRNEYAHTNVYGHAVRLVDAHSALAGVHLDIGCGFGAIAEPIRELGLTYIGFDLDPDGLSDLLGRGFEARTIDLLDIDSAVKTLTEALDGRPLASITILDTLEHITTGPELLGALRSLVDVATVPLIVSVPNVSHRDIALKLLTGRWDYTPTGLLDHTHVVHHTHKLLSAMAVNAGWRECAENDIVMERSDQFFPPAHVLLEPRTPVNEFLTRLRATAESFSDVNQFVRAYLPGQSRDRSLVVERLPADRGPFLTVVLRTQGRRPTALLDALLCLTAQSDQDFEIVLVVHRPSLSEQASVEAAIEDLPARMRSRTRLLVVDGGGRARPLNVGFEAARGLYVAALDDDDLVFANWVEVFHSEAAKSPGRLVRAVAVEQEITSGLWGHDIKGFRPSGPVRKAFPSYYDLFAHFTQNFSPFMSWAFPRSLFRDLGERFDESLDTTEDWDFELRGALLCGVQETDQITCIYRRWQTGEASHTLHSPKEWRSIAERIILKLDAVPHVFPAGTIEALRSGACARGVDDRPATAARIRELEHTVHVLRVEYDLLRIEHDARVAQVTEIFGSTSWRMTGGVRRLGRLVRTGPDRGSGKAL
jgi:Glycosyl transferase family 2